jgi:hypothetical protein
MSLFEKKYSLGRFTVSTFLVMINFAFSAFAGEFDTDWLLDPETPSAKIVGELNGLTPMQTVHMSYKKAFSIQDFSIKTQITHHRVGRAVRLFEDGMVEVEWELKDGLPTLTLNSEKVRIEDLSPEVSRLNDFSFGKAINYDSILGRKPYSFEGTVRRVFANGQIEVEWDTKNGKNIHPALSYWASGQFQLNQNDSAGELLSPSSHPLLALTSFERGLKEVEPDYLNMLDQFVLIRGDAACRAGGFKGLATRPQIEVVDIRQMDRNLKTFGAFLPVTASDELIYGEFPQAREWSWSHRRDKASKAAAAGVAVGSVAAFGLGLALTPFTGGVSALVGMGAFSAVFVGGANMVMTPNGYQGHLSYDRVLERNDSGKVVNPHSKKHGNKILPLIFKQIRCAVVTEDLLKFDASWIVPNSVRKVTRSPYQGPLIHLVPTHKPSL